MSIEDLLKENTAALKELTAVTKDLIALRTDAIETVKAEAAPKATTKTSTKKPETAVAETTAAAAAETAAPATTEAASAPADALSSEQHGAIRDLVAKYMGGTDRPEEREARKGKMYALFNHPQVVKPGTPANSAPDTNNIMVAAYQVVVDNINGLIAKGDLTQPGAASGALV